MNKAERQERLKADRLRRHALRAASPEISTSVYLVVMDPAGIFGAFLSRSRAIEAAKATESVVAELPIIADFRTVHDAPH